MESIILIKQHKNIQLAHLYEHLFTFALNNFFYSKDVFRYLDYSANGTTYHQGGLIEIEIELYTEKARKYINDISGVKLDFGALDDEVMKALSQISAEEPKLLEIKDKNNVIFELMALDNVAWQDMNDVELINTREFRQSHSPIRFSKEEVRKPRELHISFTLNEEIDQKQPQLFPLFIFLSRFLTQSTYYFTGFEHGLYPADIYGKKLSTFSLLLCAQKDVKNLDITKVEQTIIQTIQKVLTDETIGRIIEDLASVDFRKQYYTAPNHERYLDDSGFLIGASGWKKLATRQNIQHILNNTRLEVKFGRKSFTKPLP